MGIQRENVRDPACLLVSRCILLQLAVLISEAQTAILSYCCLAATPEPIDGGLGRPSPALSHLPLESGRLSGSYPKMGQSESEKGARKMPLFEYHMY